MSISFRRDQNRQAYRTLNQKDNIRIVGKHIKLPKVGFIKIKQSIDVGHINNVTVEKTPTGKYLVVLNVDFEPVRIANGGGRIGIDVGVKEFYTDSNGAVVENPKYLEASLRKLARESRRLARKQKGSNNRRKQRLKVAGVHEHVTNQRNDFLQKQSSILVRENQTICIEDLNVKGMIKNHRIAKSIASVSWSKFFSMLEYKAEWYGSAIIKVPTMYPSSQTCNCCGYKKPARKKSCRPEMGMPGVPYDSRPG
jgi:putative transposase